MSSFCKCKSYSHFFSKNISVHAIFNDQSFNNMLTDDIVSFEQLGPDKYFSYFSTIEYVVGTVFNLTACLGFSELLGKLVVLDKVPSGGTYTPNQCYHLFLKNARYVALTGDGIYSKHTKCLHYCREADNILRHPNLIWCLIANFVLFCSPSWIWHHSKQTNK